MSKNKMNVAKKLIVIQKIAWRVRCTSTLLRWILSSMSAPAMRLYWSAIWLCCLSESALSVNKHQLFCSKYIKRAVTRISSTNTWHIYRGTDTYNHFDGLSRFPALADLSLAYCPPKLGITSITHHSKLMFTSCPTHVSTFRWPQHKCMFATYSMLLNCHYLCKWLHEIMLTLLTLAEIDLSKLVSDCILKLV